MKKSNQSGFAAIEAVLILVVVSILGFTGWFVWHAKQNANAALSNAANSQPKASKASKGAASPSDGGWKTYTSSLTKTSLQYPSSWKIMRNADPDIFQLESPDGWTVWFAVNKKDPSDTNTESNSAYSGCGHGSACDVDDIYSIDKIAANNGFGDEYILQTAVHTNNIANPTDSYFIWLEKPLSGTSLPQLGVTTLPEGKMYFFGMLGLPDLHVGLYANHAAKPYSDSKAAFKSKDAEQIRQILSSFKRV
jgi:hypothetical protein